MVNSRRKGNTAEREVVTILRSHFPGKWERKSMGIPGPDILPPDGFPYAIEVKNVKTVRLKHLFQPTLQLRGFWKQAVRQANDLNTEPLLIAKIEGIWFAFESTSEGGYQWSELRPWCYLAVRRVRL